jgi:hypothetical protein
MVASERRIGLLIKGRVEQEFWLAFVVVKYPAPIPIFILFLCLPLLSSRFAASSCALYRLAIPYQLSLLFSALLDS